MTDTSFLPSSWQKVIGDEFHQPYMKSLSAFLKAELKKKKVIFPEPKSIFNAFQHTPYDKVKVVILGQDPYHGAGQAHGLSFSVKPGVRFPPSLNNIFKELERDLKISKPKSGDLTKWADQGVLLLNTVLTVEEGKAFSHANKGWEQFTDKVIEVLNERSQPIVFILWGSHAQKKAQGIDSKKHFVIKSVHPSPLSASRGFFGSAPFSKTNKILQKIGVTPIDWDLESGARKNEHVSSETRT